jgi:hypothetical protein
MERDIGWAANVVRDRQVGKHRGASRRRQRRKDEGEWRREGEWWVKVDVG